MVHKSIKEHGYFEGSGKEPCEKYGLYPPNEEKFKLINWTYNPFGEESDNGPGYYASYYIGAQWVKDKEGKALTPSEAIVVTPKMERIDFMRMFMTCFNSGIEVESFNDIYKMDVGEPSIEAPALYSILSSLLIIHFLSVVNRIKTLKKGYVHRSENLKKVKGHINIMKNERKNVMMKRFSRICCDYDEYSVDIPENRLIKKALLFAKQMVQNVDGQSSSNSSLRVLLGKDIAMFEQVSAEVEIREVKQIRGHKLFTEYKEAIRLAKLILRHFDYSISKVAEEEKEVTPFVLDMSLLYEHYVLGLLYQAYNRENIAYQFNGTFRELPDFLYRAKEFKAVPNAKYKPRLKVSDDDKDDVRQLSGYTRDIKVLRWLGYDTTEEVTSVGVVPCILIYPSEGDDKNVNPFMLKSLQDFCVDANNKMEGWYRFYKIEVPLPTITHKFFQTQDPR